MQRYNLPAVRLKTIVALPVTRFVIALALVTIALALFATEDAEATHYRYATLSWEGTDTPNEAEFSGSFAVRHSFPDFNDPEVGDVIDLQADLVTGGNFYPVHLKVDSINNAHDWLFGSIVNSNGDPIRHTYNSPNNNGDPHPVSWMDCCRLLEDDGLDLNHHVNNHHDGTGNLRLEAEVDLAPEGARSAKTTHNPITPCPREGLCTFQITSDPGFDFVDFRLATPTEAGGPSGFVQPGPPHSDFAAEIDLDTGVVTWNTTGAIFDANFANNLYSMQVVIEFNGHRTPLDFLIRLIHDDESPPFWVEPPTPCDETLTASVGSPFSFNIEGQSPHEDRTVTLDHLGLPPGASLTIDPPIPDNPATGTFEWTPTGDDVGTHIVVFRIEDNTGLNGPGCNVSIEVEEDDSDLDVNKTAVQPSISAGEQASFSISVDNIGNSTALDVELTDTLPSGLSWTITDESGGAACDITAGELECTIDELDPGEGFSVTVEATTTSAQCSGPLENTAFADASNQEPTSEDSATITVECPELVVDKSPHNDPINAGEDAGFTITVTNIGNGTAFDAMLTDELPAGLTWNDDNAACAIIDETLECDIGTLLPGEDFAVNISAITTASECGPDSLWNNAIIQASNQDGSSEDSASINVECPELEVVKTAVNDTIGAEEDAEFTITVTNIGDGTAFDVTLTDDLPGGLDWADDNMNCTIMDNTLECDVGTLLTGEEFSVNVSATTSASDCGTEPLSNTAFANASNQEGSSQDSASITVECPDLQIVKTTTNGTINAGEDAEFTITVTNHGPGTAFDVNITDDLPAGLSWTTDNMACSITGNKLECDTACSITENTMECEVGNLAPTQDFSVTVSANTSAIDCGTESLLNTAFANASNHEEIQSETVTISVECPDLEVVKIAENDPITAGEDVEFTITVTNHGPGTAFDVNITDDVPAGLSWTDDSEDCSISDNALECDVGTLLAGEDFTVSVSATTSARDCGIESLSNTAFANASNHDEVQSQTATITVECPDLEVVKIAENDPIAAGEDAEFTIAVTNNGNGTAFDVNLTDDLPSGLDWTDDNVNCTIMDNTLECDVGTLLVDEEFSVTVRATTTASECGTGSLSNTAFAQASNQQGSSEDSATIAVECPELEVVKSAVNDPISAGEDAEFTIAVTNIGNATALDVQITDDLPGGLDWSQDNDACSITDNTLECDVGTLQAGDEFLVTVSATTTASECSTGSLSNTALAQASNQQGSSEDSATITVECPELVVQKSASNDPISAGEEAEFTITVTNIGNGTALDVVLTDELPAGLNWIDDNPSCAIATNALECDIGTLLPDEDFVVNVRATTMGNECGPESLWNNAIVNASNQDGSAEDSASVTVDCPELQVVKTAVNDPVSAGEDAEFTITVTNIGNAAAFNVTLTDDLPGGLDWSQDNDACSITDGTLECYIGTLMTGEDFSVTVRAATTTNECGTEPLSNTAFADASNQEGPSQGSASITVECPELVVDKIAVNDPVSAGEDAEFTITVTNTGNGTAFNVTLTDDLPGGLDWSEENDACSITDGTLECYIGTLMTGEDFSVTVRAATTTNQCVTEPVSNTAFAEASNQEGSSEDSATITVDCPELEVVKSASNDPISAGEDAEFTITVTNTGNGTAFDVTLTDDLPGGLDWSQDNDACTITDGTLECDVGTLLTGEDFSVDVRATTSHIDCGDEGIMNTAAADASNQNTTSDGSATITVECPELVVEKTAVNSPVSAGEDAEFIITVTNVGNGTAFDVDLTDDLPEGLDWSEENDSCNITNNILECVIGTLETDDAFNVSVKAATFPPQCSQSLDNTAFADATNQNGTSQDSAAITVECPELVLEKTASPATVGLGENATFAINVANIGSGAAFDVSVTDELPSGLEWEIVGDHPDCAIGENNTLECTLSTLEPGAGLSVTVSAPVTGEACALITNNVTLDAFNHAPLNDTAQVLCFQAQALAQILYSAITTPESVEYQTHGVDQRGEGEDTRRVVGIDTEAFLGETVLPQVEGEALKEHGEVYYDGQWVNVSAYTTATEVRLMGGQIVIQILHNEGNLSWDPLDGAYDVDGFYRIASLEVFGEEISVDGTPMRVDLPGGGYLDLFTEELDDEGDQVTYRSRLAHLYLPVRLEPDLSELPLPLQELITANATRAEVIVGEVQLRAGFGMNLTGQERLILEPDDAGSGRDASLDDPVALGTGVYEGGLPDGDESDAYAIEADAGDTLAVVLEPASRTWAQGGSVDVEEAGVVDPPETTFSLRDYRLRLLDPDDTIVMEQYTEEGVVPAVVLHSSLQTGTYRVVIDSLQDPPAANYTLAVVVAPIELPLDLPLDDPLAGGVEPVQVPTWRQASSGGPVVDRFLSRTDL